ncbi:MAG: ABC transporter substrate-binding protein [Pseudomonas sp.]|uniref:substrate-binding periplasmic protein n=1 Tax=Pseudomonas sp. TaxID=306 RepID=UPI003393C4DC
MVALLLTLFASELHASEVLMAFGEKIPPFCFPETRSGIELEVIGEALAYRGHRLAPRFYPFARVPLSFINGEVDAAMTDLGQDLTPYGAHYGDPAVFYDNVFVTLQARHLQIRTPADLAGLRVIAFQGASKRYPLWLAPVIAAGNYHEQADQETQVLALEKERHDVVLSDRSIFRYYSLRLKNHRGYSLRPVEEHRFVQLEPNDYRPVFRNQQVRDDFNVGLQQLKQSGRYQAIHDKYLKE